MPHDRRKSEAISALIKIAVWEGLVLIVVVASFFATGSVAVLVAGVIASTALFAPMFLRWMREHSGALRAKPSSVEGGDGG